VKADMVKLLFTYTITLLILLGGFYALVIYKFDLDQLVKGALIGFMGMSINFLYGEQVSTRTSHQQAAATAASVNTVPNGPTTTTATGGPTPSVTVESAPIDSSVIG
jgi:ABC-type uncharacterized transport system permease subunit